MCSFFIEGRLGFQSPLLITDDNYDYDDEDGDGDDDGDGDGDGDDDDDGDIKTFYCFQHFTVHSSFHDRDVFPGHREAVVVVSYVIHHTLIRTTCLSDLHTLLFSSSHTFILHLLLLLRILHTSYFCILL